MNEQYFTSLNGYYVKDKEAIHTYDSVAEMKADSKIKEGAYVKTRGYHNVNDGGNGEYLIRTKNQDDVEDNGSIHFTQNNLVAELITKNVVNYNQFGAYGDGQNDDFQAIEKTHNFANENKLNVEAVTKSTYYIGEINDSIIVKTNTNLNNANFIIDDSVIDFSNKEIPIYKIISNVDDIVLPTNTIPSLTKFQNKISQLQGYGDKLVYVVNSNKQDFIRRGINPGSSDRQDVFRINNNGEVLDDIIWDFNEITSLELKHIDKEFIYFKNGNFTTKVNTVDSYSYYYRNIECHRSNVEIKNINHYITGEDNTSISSPYFGFITTYFATNVKIHNCTLTGHKIYRDSTTNAEKGSYDIQNRLSIDIYMSNINQSNNITDNTLWGIHTSNYCKNLHFDNCIISRIDAHRGLYNVDINNCKLGYQGIRFVGYGIANINNTDVYNGIEFVQLRNDYGATWDGDININNCSLNINDNDDQVKAIVKSYHTPDWDFGYKCYIPNLNINNFKFIGNSTNKCDVLATRDYDNFPSNLANNIDYSISYDENVSNNVYPQIMCKYIKLNNLETYRDNDYFNIFINEIENFYCENTGKAINYNELTNIFGTNTDFIFNFELDVNNVKLRNYDNENYSSDRCSLWNKGAYRRVDFTNTHRTVSKINIDNQDNLYLGMTGRAVYLNVMNSIIKMIRSGYNGSSSFFDIENCRIKYNYQSTPSSNNNCFEINRYSFILNKCKFDLQDGYTLSDIYNYEIPFKLINSASSLSVTNSNYWISLGGVWKNNSFWEGINNQINQISRFQDWKNNYGISNNVFFTNETIKYIPRCKGSLTNRPNQDADRGFIIPAGFIYMDTDNTRPIYYTGSNWIDSTGNTVS